MSDQTLNLKRAARDGYAFILQWKDTTEESLTNAFEQILPKDSRFHKKIINFNGLVYITIILIIQ